MIHEIYNTLQAMHEELRAMRDIMEKKSGGRDKNAARKVTVIVNRGNFQIDRLGEFVERLNKSLEGLQEQPEVKIIIK